MIIRRLRSSSWLTSLLLSSVLLAFLASGCMWGVVRDADTGKPLAGVKVTVTDTQGQTLSTTTDANGLYGFGAPVSPAPARGPVDFQIDTPSYQPLSDTRDVLYGDNPNATLGDMSSFWDVQAFAIRRVPGGYYNSEGRFGLVFPANWAVFGLPGAPAVIASAGSHTEDPGATCRITAGPIPPGATLRSFVDDLLSMLKNAEEISKLRVQETVDTSVNGLAAVKVVYSYDYSNYVLDNRITTQSLEDVVYYIGKDEMGYLIECYTFAEKFSGTSPTFEGIIHSFRAN